CELTHERLVRESHLTNLIVQGSFGDRIHDSDPAFFRHISLLECQTHGNEVVNGQDVVRTTSHPTVGIPINLVQIAEGLYVSLSQQARLISLLDLIQMLLRNLGFNSGKSVSILLQLIRNVGTRLLVLGDAQSNLTSIHRIVLRSGILGIVVDDRFADRRNEQRVTVAKIRNISEQPVRQEAVLKLLQNYIRIYLCFDNSTSILGSIAISHTNSPKYLFQVDLI